MTVSNVGTKDCSIINISVTLLQIIFVLYNRLFDRVLVRASGRSITAVLTRRLDWVVTEWYQSRSLEHNLNAATIIV